MCVFVTKHSLHATALQHYPFVSDQYKTVGRKFAALMKEKGQMEEAGVLFGQVGLRIISPFPNYFRTISGLFPDYFLQVCILL